MKDPLPRRDSGGTLNAEIERLIHQNEVIRADAAGLAADMSEEQFNWSPGDGRWSVGQCFDHLNVSNRLWLPMIAVATSDGRRRGLLHDGPYSYGFLSRMFLRLVEPPAKLKVGAPRGFHPADGLQRQAVMREFDAIHEQLGTLIRSANGLDLARIRCPSAFSRHVRYNLGMSFWILMAHDRRHIWQARNVCQAAGFPSVRVAPAG